MAKDYKHITPEERSEIARLQASGHTNAEIAAALDRSPSSISRELRRNKGSKIGYNSGFADRQAKARRWSGSRLGRDEALREKVLGGLSAGLSPEQVAGRLARDAGERVISHETIYRFIYAQMKRTQDFSWRNYLPCAKTRRGWRSHRGKSPTRYMQNWKSVHERPLEASDRSIPGHWEADLALFAKHGQSILAIREKSSGIIFARRSPTKQANQIATLLEAMFGPLPESLRRTVTFDNGSEFAQHSRLHKLKLDTYFCDTHSPWQKDGIENAIGWLRRFLPTKTDLDYVSEAEFKDLIDLYNNTPRKRLDYQTPTEAFLAELLHFECESTS